jgi:hypothetical protein
MEEIGALILPYYKTKTCLHKHLIFDKGVKTAKQGTRDAHTKISFIHLTLTNI